MIWVACTFGDDELCLTLVLHDYVKPLAHMMSYYWNTFRENPACDRKECTWLNDFSLFCCSTVLNSSGLIWLDCSHVILVMVGIHTQRLVYWFWSFTISHLQHIWVWMSLLHYPSHVYNLYTTPTHFGWFLAIAYLGHIHRLTIYFGS